MKTLERLVTKYLMRAVYIISSILPIKKRVVFATYRTLELEDNFKYIYEEIKRQNLDYDCFCLFKKVDPGIVGKVKYLFHMMRATFYMATSEFFLIDDYYFPVYCIKPRRGTEIVQVWHACGAFKKFGYSTLDKNYGANNDYIKYIPIHTNYDHVLVSAKEVAKYYAEAFNMSENNIDPIGVPRTDLFFDKEKQEINKLKLYKAYPKLKDKKLILYAPTFRGTSQSNAKLDITFDLEKVLKNIPKDCILGLKMHPFVKTRIDDSKYDNLIDLSDYDNINDILLISEMLITDYSSVVFEYSLLERPILFYSPDRDLYKEERDFYYDYESFVPGPIITNTEELIKGINNESFDRDRVIAFKKKFFDYLDGKSSKRFVDKIILKK